MLSCSTCGDSRHGVWPDLYHSIGRETSHAAHQIWRQETAFSNVATSYSVSAKGQAQELRHAQHHFWCPVLVVSKGEALNAVCDWTYI